VALVAVILPYVPISGRFGFVPLPLSLLLTVLLLTGLYVCSVELAKRYFYRLEVNRLQGC
jgi:Mg2+-importing ATPase